MFKGTPDDLKRCRQYLKECLGHRKCVKAPRKAGHYIAPERILDVQEHANARMYSLSPGDYPRYVALRYCWGDTQPEQVKTTKANLQSRQDVTNLSGLAQTIRDAIQVCFSLGSHYIWIDALCIVQDDDDEKVSEIADIQSIYRGAALLSALQAQLTVRTTFFKTVHSNECTANRSAYRTIASRTSTPQNVTYFCPSYQQVTNIESLSADEAGQCTKTCRLRFGSKQTT
ncbi:hypothetical protein GT037_003400 [Alternaria burnsii]|uniref:Heterokaryon incompatibility domain-containing protein n=1 Tax=Alternaria burnsii TaxID=1187904 RepID=A0A8H7BCU5_9PLEO|nr:uncharacterized protein GT037_003400 [Alternaria burnsii]KAF7679652.1 hypothetical protein GT037_003400 [Alternaria burnsii]